ncbi:MAG: hypothetical protein WDW38_003524 [Sanguina aurantia]
MHIILNLPHPSSLIPRPVSVEWHNMASNTTWTFNPSVMLANALTALILNLAVFLLIGKTSGPDDEHRWPQPKDTEGSKDEILTEIRRLQSEMSALEDRVSISTKLMSGEERSASNGGAGGGGGLVAAGGGASGAGLGADGGHQEGDEQEDKDK